MKTPTALLAAASLFGTALFLYLGLVVFQPTSPHTTATAPPFSGQELITAQPWTWPTGHPILLSFGASWCEPCRKEIHILTQLSQKKRNVHIVGICTQDTREACISMHQEEKPHYPILWDKNNHIGSLYDAQILPTLVFIDRRGKIVQKATGAIPEEALENALQKLAELP